MSDENNELEDDDLFDQIIDQGEVVFSHDWDSGAPGVGAGSEQVYLWKGRFFIYSLDCGKFGPFASLDEALQEQDLLMVTSATTSIQCTLLEANELAKRLECDEDGYEIEINGESWVYRAADGGFTRSSAKA
jgi:hypothetical protein